MDSWVVAMMLGVSIFLGAIALFAFMWAVKNGQFDDEEKFLNGAKFDGVEDLRDAQKQEAKKKSLKNENS